jgi:hypothetical protein
MFQMIDHAAIHAVPPGTSSHPWATASHADLAETSPGDLSALGAHVDRCNGSRGRLFALRCAADAVVGFAAPRFVTTVVVIVFIFGVASLVL